MSEWITISGYETSYYMDIETTSLTKYTFTITKDKLHCLKTFKSWKEVLPDATPGEDFYVILNPYSSSLLVKLFLTKEEYLRIKSILMNKEPKTTIVDAPQPPPSPLDGIKTLGSK